MKDNQSRKIPPTLDSRTDPGKSPRRTKIEAHAHLLCASPLILHFLNRTTESQSSTDKTYTSQDGRTFYILISISYTKIRLDTASQAH